MAKTQYKCNSCNWRWGSTTPPNQCTYCGKKDFEVYESEEAQSLIDEVTDMERQFNQRE